MHLNVFSVIWPAVARNYPSTYTDTTWYLRRRNSFNNSIVSFPLSLFSALHVEVDRLRVGRYQLLNTNDMQQQASLGIAIGGDWPKVHLITVASTQ
jgi:hypothetical protein